MFAHRIIRRTRTLYSRPTSLLVSPPMEAISESEDESLPDSPLSRSNSSDSESFYKNDNDSEATLVNDILILQLAKDSKGQDDEEPISDLPVTPILPRMDTVTYIDIAAENPFSDIHPALRSHVSSYSRSVSTSSSDTNSSSDSVQVLSSQPDSVVIKRNLPYRDPSNRNSSVSVQSTASSMTSRDGGKSRYSSRFIIEQSQSYKKSRCQEERYNKVVQQLAFA